MKRKNLLRVICLCLCLCLVLTGCGPLSALSGLVGMLDGSDSTPTPAPKESGTPDPNAPKDYSKYNSYLALSDAMYEMESLLEAYFKNVEYAEDFALTEGGDYGALKDTFQFYTANTYPLKEALDYVEEAPAYAAADAAARALGNSPVEVMEALDDIGSYLRFDDYEKDSLAKAAQLHKALWEALEIYDQYYMNFLAAMNELADSTRDQDLEELREQGEMILYNSRRMIYAAQDILNDVWDQFEAGLEQSDGETLPEIDLTDISPIFKEFNTAYEELMAAMEKDEEKEKVFSGPLAESTMKLYTNKVNSLYAAMGILAQDLMDKADYADAYDNARDAVSSMIDGYNSII